MTNKHYLLKNIRMEVAYSGPLEYPMGSDLETFHIEIKDGILMKVFSEKDLLPNLPEIGGNNSLLLPSLKEMHCHLDKSKLGAPWTPISKAESLTERFTNEIIELDSLEIPLKERAKNLLETELKNGVSFFRSHIDVHQKVGQRYLNEVKELLADYEDLLDYELIAFPQHGMILSNAYSEVDTALSNGATLIGGVDPESLDGDAEKSLAQTFELAVKHQVPIDIHVHDRQEAGRKTVKQLIKYTKEANWQGKVTISHAFGLNDFTGGEREEIFHEMGKQKIAVISSVTINGVIPPLKELQRLGVEVHLGCDNVYDSWSPFGTGNINEKLNQYCEIFGLSSQKDLTNAFQLISSPYEISDDCEPWLQKNMNASFILTNASSTAEYVARMRPIVSSYYKGQEIISTLKSHIC